MAPRTTKTTKPADPFADSTDDTKDNTVSDNQNNEKLTVTLKGGTGYDAPWIVVHANDAADALSQLKDDTMKDLMDFTAETGQYFAGLAPKPAARAATGGGQSSAPQGGGGAGKECKHGQMTYRSGSKNGNTWQGYFCPTPQGTPDQCKPQFIR